MTYKEKIIEEINELVGCFDYTDIDSRIEIEASYFFADKIKNFIFNHFHQLREQQKKEVILKYMFENGRTSQIAVLMCLIHTKKEMLQFRKTHKKKIEELAQEKFLNWLENDVVFWKNQNTQKNI